MHQTLEVGEESSRAAPTGSSLVTFEAAPPPLPPPPHEPPSHAPDDEQHEAEDDSLLPEQSFAITRSEARTLNPDESLAPSEFDLPRPLNSSGSFDMDEAQSQSSSAPTPSNEPNNETLDSTGLWNMKIDDGTSSVETQPTPGRQNVAETQLTTEAQPVAETQSTQKKKHNWRVITHAVQSLWKSTHFQWKPVRFEHYKQGWRIVLEWESDPAAECYVLYKRRSSEAWHRHETIKGRTSCKIDWKNGEPEAGIQFILRSEDKADDPSKFSQVLGPVVPPSAPGPVRQVAVTEVAPCTLEVSWKPPAEPPESCGGHSSQVLDYEVLLENELQQQSLTVSKTCEATISDIDANHCYTIMVCAVNELDRRGPYCIAPRSVEVRSVYTPTLPLDFCAARSWTANKKAPIPVEWRCWWPLDIIVCFIAIMAPIACDMELAVSLYCEAGDPLLMSLLFSVYYTVGAIATYVAEKMEAISPPALTAFFAKIVFCFATLAFHLYVCFIRSDRSDNTGEGMDFLWNFERAFYRLILKLRDSLPSSSERTQETLLLLLARALSGMSSAALRQLTLHVFLPSEALSKRNRRCLSFCVSFLLSKCAPLGLAFLALVLGSGYEIDEATYSLTRGLVLVVLVSAIGGLICGPHSSRPEAALSLFRVSTPAVLRRYICLCEAELRKAVDSLLDKESWNFAAEVRGCLLSWEGMNKPLWMWSLRSLSLLDDQAPLLGLSDASILTAMAALLRKQLLGAEDDVIESFEIARSHILKRKHQQLSEAAHRLILDVLCIGAALMDLEQEKGHSIEEHSKDKTTKLSYSVADLHMALSNVHKISHLAIPCPDIATAHIVSRTSRHAWLSRLGCCHCCDVPELEQRLATDRAVHMLYQQDSQGSATGNATLTRDLSATWDGACPKWADIIALCEGNFMLNTFHEKYKGLVTAIHQLSIGTQTKLEPTKRGRESEKTFKEAEKVLGEFREKYEERFGKIFAASESEESEISEVYTFVKEIMALTTKEYESGKPPVTQEYEWWKPSVGYALTCLIRKPDTGRFNEFLDNGLDDIASRLLREFIAAIQYIQRKSHADKQRKRARDRADRAKHFIKAFLRVRFFGVHTWTARAAFDVYALARECQLAIRDGASLTAEEEAACRSSVHSLKEVWSSDFQNQHFLTVTFKPGSHGMSGDWDHGKVTRVDDGSQAYHDGVKDGMHIWKIDGCDYSKGMLDTCAKGDSSYEVMFTKETVLCDAMPELISMCKGETEHVLEVLGNLLDHDESLEVVAARLTSVTNWIDSYCAELRRRLEEGPHLPVPVCEETHAHSGVEALAAAVALGFENVEELNIVAEGCNVLVLHLGLHYKDPDGKLTILRPIGICFGAMLNLCDAITASMKSSEPQDDLPARLLESLHMSLSGDFNWQPFFDMVEKGDACKFLAAIAAGGGIGAEVAWSPTVRRTSEDAEIAQVLLLLLLRMVRSGSIPPPLPPLPPDLPKDERRVDWVLRYLGCRGDGLLNMDDAFLMINAIKGPGTNCDLTMYNEFCTLRGTSPSVGLTLEDARFILQTVEQSATDPARTLYDEFELAIGGYGRGFIQHSERRRRTLEVHVQTSALVAWGASDTLGLWLTHFFGPQNTKADASKLASSQKQSQGCLRCFHCCAKAKPDTGLKNVRTSELRGILALQNRPHELARTWRAAAVQGAISVAPWRRARGVGLSRIVNSSRAGNKRSQRILPYAEPTEQANSSSDSGFDLNAKVRKFQTDFCHSPTVMWKGGLRRDELRHLAAIKVYRRHWFLETFAYHRMGCNSHVWPAMVSTCILAVVEAGLFSLLPQFFRNQHRDFGMSIEGAAGVAAGVLASLVFGQVLGALHLEFRLKSMKECELPVTQEKLQTSKQAWESDCLAMSICINLAAIIYTIVWLPGISFPNNVPLLNVAAILLGISRPLLELPFWLLPRKSHNDGRINTLSLNKAFVIRSIMVAFFFPYLVWFSDVEEETRETYVAYLNETIPVIVTQYQKWMQLAGNNYGHLGIFFAILQTLLLVLSLLPLVSWHSSALRKRAYSHPVRRALHFKPPQRSMARGGPPVDDRPIIIRAGARWLIVQWSSLHSTRDLVYDAQISEDFGRWGPAENLGIIWPLDRRVPRCFIPVDRIRLGVTVRLRVRCAPDSSDNLKKKLQLEEKKERLIWGPWSQHSLLIHRPSELRVNIVLRPIISFMCMPLYFLDIFLVTIPEAWLAQVWHLSSWTCLWWIIILNALWPFVVLHCLFWIFPEALLRTHRFYEKSLTQWLMMIPCLILASPFLLVYGLLLSCHEFLISWDRTKNVEALPVVEDIGPVLDLKAKWLSEAKDRQSPHQPRLQPVRSDMACHTWPKISNSSRLLVLEERFSSALHRAKAVDAKEIEDFKSQHLTIEEAEEWIKNPEAKMWSPEQGQIYVEELKKASNCNQDKYKASLLTFRSDLENPKEENIKLKLTISRGDKDTPLHVCCYLKNCNDSSMLEKCIGSRIEKLVSCYGHSADATTSHRSENARRWSLRKRVCGDTVFFVPSEVVHPLLDVPAFIEKMIQQGATALIFSTTSFGSLPISADWSRDSINDNVEDDTEDVTLPLFLLNDREAEKLQVDIGLGSASIVRGFGLCVDDPNFQELEATWTPTGVYTRCLDERSSIIVLQHRSINFSKNEEFGEDSWTTCAIVDPNSRGVRCTAPRTAEGAQFRLLGDAQHAWQPLTKFIELEEIPLIQEHVPVVQKQVETCEPEILRLARQQPNSCPKPGDFTNISSMTPGPAEELKKRHRRNAQADVQKQTKISSVNAGAGSRNSPTPIMSDEDVSISVQPQVEMQLSLPVQDNLDQAMQKTLLYTPSGNLLDVGKVPSVIATPPRYEPWAQAQWGNLNKKVAPRFNNLDWLG